MRARTRPPTPFASSTQRPYRAAASRDASATRRYGASCNGKRENAAAPRASSAGSVSDATDAGKASGAARLDSASVVAPPGASSSLAWTISAGGFHSGSRSQSAASPDA